LKSQTAIVDTSSHSDIALLRVVESGDAGNMLRFHYVFVFLTDTTISDQLVELLKLGANPNIQLVDGNTCLHISTAKGHIE
jgi:ankyrin repeat protein